LGELSKDRFLRLYQFIAERKLEIRVLPDNAFGLIHGKAGVITDTDGRQTCFIGSANESLSAWKLNYELVGRTILPMPSSGYRMNLTRSGFIRRPLL